MTLRNIKLKKQKDTTSTPGPCNLTTKDVRPTWEDAKEAASVTTSGAATGGGVKSKTKNCTVNVQTAPDAKIITKSRTSCRPLIIMEWSQVFRLGRRNVGDTTESRFIAICKNP